MSLGNKHVLDGLIPWLQKVVIRMSTVYSLEVKEPQRVWQIERFQLDQIECNSTHSTVSGSPDRTVFL